MQSTLFQDLSLLFRSELSDPRFEGVSPTSFELTPDGRLIRIGYTLTPAAASGAREVQEALGRASGYLRSQLAQHLDLKRVPQLRFIYIGVAEVSMDAAPPVVESSDDTSVIEDEDSTFPSYDGDDEGGER